MCQLTYVTHIQNTTHTADFSCLVDCDFILDLEADDFRALARWLQLYNKVCLFGVCGGGKTL